MNPYKLEELKLLDGYFRAANYLTAAQLYLVNNPLLRRPLEASDVKDKIIGHWGTCPGQTFIYTHCNRVIKKYDLDMFYVSGPGHGGNSIVSQVYLEGTYSDVYKNIPENEEGLKKLFKQFSFPGGISSHVAPETPGSIHEGGELGYSLAHSFGAVLDNPDLIVTCVVGDGEAETGPLATSWHSNKFINPITDGAVLPILHLNGYKISNPSVLSRISNQELENFFRGCGYIPYFVEGKDPMRMHLAMSDVMDECIETIKGIQRKARTSNNPTRPLWPMIILRTPKGWTGPKVVDNNTIEDSFRAHQVPITMDKPHHLELLEKWLKSYRPEELFDDSGRLNEKYRQLIPEKSKRMGSNKHANGGLLLKELVTPKIEKFALDVLKPGSIEAQDMQVLGGYIKDVIELNPNNYRLFGPDETMSNRLSKVFESTKRAFNAKQYSTDEFLNPNGRVMDSMLSEHLCEGWLEGYLLTGRHGAFSSYEAFLRVIDSMTTQHSKWLKMTSEIPWREDISSLNYLVTSHIWQQDHNGYTHQDPGFLGHISDKKSEFIRAYLPPDANCLLAVFDEASKSKHKINAIVASKHPRPQWLNINQAKIHCQKGLSIWDFASNDIGCEPDVVVVSCGDTPTLETLAATDILRSKTDIKIRYINVVDLYKFASPDIHPNGLSNEMFDALFTKDKPIIVGFHGYPTLLRNLLYSRTNRNVSIHGYNEEGAITTPFDMRVKNKLDRFNLVKDIINHVPRISNRDEIIKEMDDLLLKHNSYIREFGKDIPEVSNWVWSK